MLGVLTPLSAIFQLYHGDKYLLVEDAVVPGETLTIISEFITSVYPYTTPPHTD